MIAALYAAFVGWTSPDLAGFIAFFAQLWLDGPFADPQIPALVYEDPAAGVVGFVGSNPRQYAFGDRTLRIACSGPIVIDPEHQRRGIATALKRAYGEGPQEMTVNDRVVDRVHGAWVRLGAITDATASIEWVRVLAPVGLAANVASHRVAHRQAPGRASIRRIDRMVGRRLKPAPPKGSSEPLSAEAMVGLLSGLREDFPLSPLYDERSLEWLFRTMETVDPDLGRLERRLVRDDEGRPLGAYIAFMAEAKTAEVMQIAAAPANAGLVLDHLFADATERGALDVRGRLKPYLLSHLRSRKVVLRPGYWAILQCEDAELISAVLSGRALMTRLEGEWWMRPWPAPA